MLADLLPSDRLAPFNLKSDRVSTATLGDVKPLVRKGSTHTVEDFASPHEVADRALHHAPSGGSGEKDGMFGLKEFLKARLDAAVKLLKVPASVTNHGLAKSSEGLV
jgi:hypothetical protein